MPVDRFLAGRTIALSISDSPDLRALGLTQGHLRDALGELARHLLAEGAQLTYGGDLRANGFTELLFELAYRHARDLSEPVVINPLPWPVHCGKPWSELEARAKAVAPVARIEFLALDGTVMSPDQRANLPEHTPSEDEWKDGLTAMRTAVAQRVDAAVLLGGQVDVNKIKGRMPGIAEEALAAMGVARPVYLAGGFGGCTRDIAEVLELAPPHPLSHAAEWNAATLLVNRRAENLRSGLDRDDLKRLAVTPNVDEMVVLVLRGLRHLVVKDVKG